MNKNTLPPSIVVTCTDTDNGAKDPYGDGCAAYNSNTGWCGNYDTGDLKSTVMCCACGGGNTSGNIPDIL